MEYIEEEAYLSTAALDRSSLAPYLWHLDRIDQVSTTLDGTEYRPVGDGEGVDIYVLDTG